MILAVVNWDPDVSAFMGGLGVGLSVYFIALLFTVGVGAVRRVFL